VSQCASFANSTIAVCLASHFCNNPTRPSEFVMEASTRPKKTIRPSPRLRPPCRTGPAVRAATGRSNPRLHRARPWRKRIDASSAESGLHRGCPWPSISRGSSRRSRTATFARPTTFWPPTTSCRHLRPGLPARTSAKPCASWATSWNRWASAAGGFVGDLAPRTDGHRPPRSRRTATKAAMIGSGPASITCAVDLARTGVE